MLNLRKIHTLLLDILLAKEFSNLIGEEYLGLQLEEKNFSRHEVCSGNLKNYRFSF